MSIGTEAVQHLRDIVKLQPQVTQARAIEEARRFLEKLDIPGPYGPGNYASNARGSDE